MTDTTSTTVPQLDEIANAAHDAFRATSTTDAETRARWLRAIADALDAHAAELVAIADDETHLGVVRLSGEVARTTGQLRLFADVVIEGAYLELTIDHALSSATPPRPDLRRMLVPVGPVAVYAASNFPFAFSVAGGDTASALAVGCPVIVKAHPGHPRLARRTAELVAGALSQLGAPTGTFALIEGHEAGVHLVEHPAIAAAAFTGSLSGGRALFDRAAARPRPIPFYGELSSINPVVVTPGADESRGAALAEGLAQSFQLGAGQFCTKPGVVFVPRGSTLEASLEPLVGAAAHPMLNATIAEHFVDGATALAHQEAVALIAGDGTDALAPRVFAMEVEHILEGNVQAFAEVFGPVTVLVRYGELAQAVAALRMLDGSLTVTIHAEPGEHVTALVSAAGERAGRVLFAGWPTGVAVSWAQHHGGPYPATTSLHTSVGATAVRRFLRPLVYQDAPVRLLPAVLRDDPVPAVPRRVDGVLSLG